MNTFAVNTLDTNRSLVYPFDEVETRLNLIEREPRLGKEKVLGALLAALKTATRHQFKDQQVKIGLLYQAVAEYYLHQHKPALAEYYLEKAREVLEPLHLLDGHLQEELLG